MLLYYNILEIVQKHKTVLLIEHLFRDCVHLLRLALEHLLSLFRQS
jgi:hypothetical protein